jgi:hypothetical protein
MLGNPAPSLDPATCPGLWPAARGHGAWLAGSRIVDEADQKRREAEQSGQTYGTALADQIIGLFGEEITAEQADATAEVLRSEILRVGGEMIDEGIPTPLVIVWGQACAKALQSHLAEHGEHLRRLAVLLAVDPLDAVRQ